MEPQINEPQSAIEPLKKVTPLSKYLAMALFIIMPFMGGYVGYMFAPEKVVEVEKEVVREVEVVKEVLAEEKNATAFPVVAFEREGLLSDDDRAQLSEKFIEPYVDYYQMSGDSTILTAVIEVPENQDDPYVIRNVTLEGNAGGFLFGERGGDYDYWVPGCAYAECEFTDEYAQKHPEVIEQYRTDIQP